MTRIDIEQVFRNIIVDQLGVDAEEVTLDSSIEQDLGADSLDSIEIVMECEEKFGIEIPDEDIEHIQTVSQAIDYLARKVPNED